MSVEHKKPLFAFILVALVTAAIIGTSLRVEALRPIVAASVPITAPGVDVDGRLLKALGLAEEDAQAAGRRRHGDADGRQQADRPQAPEGEVILADPLPRAVTTGDRGKTRAPHHGDGRPADDQAVPRPEQPVRQHDAQSGDQSGDETRPEAPAHHGAAHQPAQSGTPASSGDDDPEPQQEPEPPHEPVPQPSRPPHTDPAPRPTQQDTATAEAIARAQKAADKMITRGLHDTADITGGLRDDVRAVTGYTQRVVVQGRRPGSGSVSRGLRDLADLSGGGYADRVTHAAADLLAKTVAGPSFGRSSR